MAGREELPRLRVYCSEAHSSVDKRWSPWVSGSTGWSTRPTPTAASIRPLEAASPRRAGPTDRRRRDGGDDLDDVIDPLPAIADICARESIWLHWTPRTAERRSSADCDGSSKGGSAVDRRQSAQVALRSDRLFGPVHSPARRPRAAFSRRVPARAGRRAEAQPHGLWRRARTTFPRAQALVRVAVRGGGSPSGAAHRPRPTVRGVGRHRGGLRRLAPLALRRRLQTPAGGDRRRSWTLSTSSSSGSQCDRQSSSRPPEGTLREVAVGNLRTDRLTCDAPGNCSASTHKKRRSHHGPGVPWTEPTLCIAASLPAPLAYSDPFMSVTCQQRYQSVRPHPHGRPLDRVGGKAGCWPSARRGDAPPPDSPGTGRWAQCWDR